MIRCIVLSVTLLLLSACTQSQYANVTMRPSEIRKNKMCMIVGKINVPYVDLFNKLGNYDGYIRLVNFEDGNKKKIYFIDGSSYLNSATMINPGTYYIDSIGWNDGLYMYEVKVPSEQLNIQSGQCIYMGDISVIRRNNGIQVLIKNNISLAISSIEDSKLELLAKRLYFIALVKNESIVKSDQ